MSSGIQTVYELMPVTEMGGTDDIIRQPVNSLMADLWDFQSALDFLAIAIFSSPGSFDLKVVDGQ